MIAMHRVSSLLVCRTLHVRGIRTQVEACSVAVVASEHNKTHWKLWDILAAAAPLLLVSGAVAISSQGSCDSYTVNAFPSPVRDFRLAMFKSWLEEHGADVAAVDFKSSQVS